MKKITKSDLGLSYDGMPAEQRTFLEKMADIMVNACNKAIEGAMTPEEVEAKFKAVNEALAQFDAEKFAEVVKDNEAMCQTLKELTDKLGKLERKGVNIGSFLSKLDENIDAIFESEKFKQFEAGTTREARGFELKDISLGGNYTGTLLITEQSPDVVSQATNKPVHVRNFASVLQGDPEYPMYAWQVIYDVDKNARYVSENGTLPESSFKVKEESTSVKRVGTHYKLSKRMLKCRTYLKSLMLNTIVEAVLDAEDTQILFGDGSGDNLKGITAYEGVMPVESIVTGTVIAGAAGSVAAVEKFGNNTVITLSKPYDLLVEGLKITLVSTVTSSTLSGTYDVIKLNDKQILIEKSLQDAAYTAENAAAASMTFSVNNAAFKSVESPNSIDALETAVAVMTYAQFRPTFLGLNPITLNSIRTEKATDGNRLRIVEDINGNPIIAGIRVTPLTSIPAGKYFLGDFRNGAEIIEYTGLTIDWADDVTTKLKNQVVLMAQEEMIVPVKCPWAFAYGSISALKSAIAKGS